MQLYKYFAERLYLRIWLTVVGGVAVLILVVGWAWQAAAEKNATPMQPPTREIYIRTTDGNALLQGLAMRQPGPPNDKVIYLIEDETGRTYEMELSRRPDRGGAHRPPPDMSPWWFWTKPPFGFLWMLGLVGIVVAVGVFPIIRRMMRRLERLRSGVKQFGDGDLSVRVDVRGNDEIGELAQQFNAAAARIEALVQSHKSLLANSSHELRSPLTRIRMGVELMDGNNPSPTFKQEIRRNIAELDQLVDEILLASRLDAREADVGTAELIDVVGLSAEECARIDAELEVTGDAVEILGIAKLVRRAIRNLLENARRYSQGAITLTVAKQGAFAEIRVADRGPGVPPDQRDRIFEPFYRMPGASERNGGVGLGLALVRSIAERYDGTVHCEAREGGGAVFVLRLPLAPAAMTQSNASGHLPH